jgi:hypothetical protein
MDAAEFARRYSDLSFASSQELMKLLEDASFREALYDRLRHNLSGADRALLRDLLRKEMTYRKDRADDDFYENLHWCAFLLYRIGDVRDAELLLQAKNIDFDTGCGFDVEFLVGAGVDETIRYLRMKSDDDSAAALEYILECKKSGDFDDLETWFRWRDQYSERTDA